MDSLLLVQQRGQKSALIQNNGDGSITNNNVWFFSQHQRLGHHIDSSNYDSWEKKGKKKRMSARNKTTDIKTINGHVPHLTPMLEPRASNCSDIWNASSLVGVRTRV